MWFIFTIIFSFIIDTQKISAWQAATTISSTVVSREQDVKIWLHDSEVELSILRRNQIMISFLFWASESCSTRNHPDLPFRDITVTTNSVLGRNSQIILLAILQPCHMAVAAVFVVTSTSSSWSQCPSSFALILIFIWSLLSSQLSSQLLS